ncbi:MAG: hypothetical protein IKS20_13125, partial [Victivallales bacterium]|nr:hypothetical protein [Victivallales bacterium]
DDFQGCAKAWGFLASPLAQKYLPQKAQQDFKAKLQHSSSKLAGSSGPILGSDFTQATYWLGTAVFVAPGMFFSPVLKTQRTISYPYWIYNKEISGEQFYRTTSFIYRRNAPYQAAEYLTWNEALYFCWRCNQILQKAAFMPEGYGVRPPTEEEWEYAALGGWEGKCAKDGPKIKNGANQAPGQGEPNALGLWNMEDNLSEIVLPYKEKPFKPAYAVAVIGGNYKEKSSITLRHLYIPDQMHMSGGGGLRPVIAPIEKDFWEKQWFRGVPIKSAEIKGNIYAGWSCCFATLGWKHALQLASDLGGSLIECTDFAEIKDIYSKLELLNSFPCPIGIQLENDAWKRVSDNTPVPLDLPRDEKKTGLWGTTSKLVPFVEDRGGPTMIIRWQDKEAFDRRETYFLEKATVARFQANGRNYAICRLGNMTSYMVRSFAEFAGCRPPVFKDSNEVNAVLENMPANFDNVALGTSRYYDKWEQPDGSSFPASNMVKEPKEANGAINTWTAKMLNIIVVQNKELTENHRAEYLLLQL